MERQVNFGHLAVHRVAVVSKEIIRQYYCSAPIYSYFYGCSKGGGQAMIEAQRYPDDFDGIVAAAPAINWPVFSAAFIHNGKAMYPDPNNFGQSLISNMHLELLQNTILEQCDTLDGIKDGILNDPTVCDFDFSQLPRCSDNQASDYCFTSVQIEGIKKIYDGLMVENEKIHPGFPYGCENEGGWSFFIVDPDAKALENLGYPTRLFALAVDVFKYLVFQDPNWDYKSYDFSNLKEDTRYASSYLDVTSKDYSAFKDHGAKMILFHGWNDPAQSAFTTIEHYEAAKNIDPQIEDYIRLFLLPGVLHCGGGPGPSEMDWIELVRDWVEMGIPPEKVVLTKTEDGKETITRPVFPYPNKAVYDGKGDPNKESSFNKSTTSNKK
jgi:feruloyl esterase